MRNTTLPSTRNESADSNVFWTSISTLPTADEALEGAAGVDEAAGAAWGGTTELAEVAADSALETTR